MNDRFKFRVWDKNHNTYIPSQMIGTLLYFGYRDEFHIEFKCFSTFADSLIIEQCTGLSDKNGNLIYESDYVKDKDGDIYLVKWDAELVQFNATGKDNCGFETLTPFMKGETDELEIIGNIHEQAKQKDK